MSKVKFFIPLFALTAILVTVGFGCKGLSQAEQAATKPVVLEMWTVFDDVDAIKNLITKFKAERPYLTINVRQLRPEELYPRLVEALAEDKSPDIISVQNHSIKAYQTKLSSMPGSVPDTTVRMVKKTVGVETVVNTQNYNLPTINQIDKEYVQTVKRDVVVDGKIYGLPLSLDTMAIYYNKDLLDRAGIPEAPKTWEEFQKAVQKLNKYNKTTGKIVQSGTALGTGNNIPSFDDILYIFLKQSGVDIFDRVNGRPVINMVAKTGNDEEVPAVYKVLDFYTDYADPTRDTYSWNDEMDNALDRFVNGSVGFFFGYSFHHKIIKARAPQMNLAVIPMLQLNEETPVNAANYWVQCVPQKSKNPNEAWNLIRYLAYSKANKDYLDATKRPTALRNYISSQSEVLELAPFVSQALAADNWYRGKNYEAAVKAMNDLVRDWLKVPADPNKIIEYKQNLLNKTAEKLRQTL